MTIQEQENELIEQFQVLDGDLEMTLNYIMEIGNELPVLPDDLRNDDHIVKGCQSKVWLAADLQEGKIHFQADSNTAITKATKAVIRPLDTNCFSEAPGLINSL